MDWSAAISFLAGFFAVLNPLGAVPVYLSLTSGYEPAEQRRVALLATVAVFLTLTIFAVVGQGVLSMFGITLPAFRVAGGILLLLIAISMLQGKLSPMKQNPSEARDAAERQSIAVIPLAIPILSGPGAISTAVLFSQQADTFGRVVALGAAIVVVTAAVYGLLRVSEKLHGRLGPIGINVGNRIMGLILAALAVQFITDGTRVLFPMLGG